MWNALIRRETNVAEVLEHHLHPLIESLLYLHVIIRNNCYNLSVHMTQISWTQNWWIFISAAGFKRSFRLISSETFVRIRDRAGDIYCLDLECDLDLDLDLDFDLVLFLDRLLSRHFELIEIVLFFVFRFKSHTKLLSQ